MWLASLCSLFSVVNTAVNMALPAFAAERRAAARGSAPSLLRGHSPLWIDISCQHGTQQQTRHTPLLRSNDGTDGRTDTAYLSYRQTGARPFINPAPQTMWTVPKMHAIRIASLAGKNGDYAPVIKHFRHNLFQLFADDLKLYTCYKTDIGLLHNDLHTAINRMTEWAKLWQLQVAIPKCPALRISNSQWNVCESVQQVTCSIDGVPLPFVDQIRDIRVCDCSLVTVG